VEINGSATLDDLPAVKSSTATQPRYWGVVISSLRMALCTNWGSGLE